MVSLFLPDIQCRFKLEWWVVIQNQRNTFAGHEFDGAWRAHRALLVPGQVEDIAKRSLLHEHVGQRRAVHPAVVDELPDGREAVLSAEPLLDQDSSLNVVLFMNCVIVSSVDLHYLVVLSEVEYTATWVGVGSARLLQVLLVDEVSVGGRQHVGWINAARIVRGIHVCESLLQVVALPAIMNLSRAEGGLTQFVALLSFVNCLRHCKAVGLG